jgi:hypothetical protein
MIPTDDPRVAEDWKLLWDDVHRRVQARLASPPAPEEERRTREE